MRRTTIRTMPRLSARHEVIDEREYIVLPVTLLVEGVHHGSEGPLYYPASVLEKAPERWDGHPVVIYHPTSDDGDYVPMFEPETIEKYQIGMLLHCTYDPAAKAIKGEAWVEKALAQKKAPEVLSMVEAGKPIEVSTGLAPSEAELTPGNWRGEDYEAILVDVVPEHLALLPGRRGACSLEDGCGIVYNDAGRSGGKGAGVTINDAVSRALRALAKAVTNELSHEEVSQALGVALREYVGEGRAAWVRQVYDSFVVYDDVEIGSSGEWVSQNMMRQGYTVDQSSGTVTIDGKPVAVREERSYVPVDGGGGDTASITASTSAVAATGNETGGAGEITPALGNQEAGADSSGQGKEITMRPAVQKIINCECTRFKAEDAAWLENLSDEELTRLTTKNADEPPPPEVKPEEPKLIGTLEELAKMVTPELAATIAELIAARDAAAKAEADAKNEVIRSLVGNQRCEFTEDELKAMPISHLNRLAKTIGGTVNYAARPATGAVQPENIRKFGDQECIVAPDPWAKK